MARPRRLTDQFFCPFRIGLMSVDRTNITITNGNSEIYRLTAPSLNFVAKALIAANSKYSLALPYSQSHSTLYELQSHTTGRVVTFTLSINGPISRTDPGLQMTDIITGTSGSQDWESAGEV